MQTKVTGLVLLLAASMPFPAQAECPKWEKLKDSGQKAIDAGDFKRAELTWVKAVAEAPNCENPDALELSLKRLGEVYIKNEKYQLAAANLKLAAARSKETGKEDPELVVDQTELDKNYRDIDFLTGIKPAVTDMFKEAGVNAIGILKLAQDQGNRIMMSLSNKFMKKIDNPDVDQVGLDKVVSFDIVEAPDGALTISNIKGLKVRAKFWVTIVQSHVKPNDPDPSADVTATKMGISKTVSCKLPSDVVDPIKTFVAKINDFTKGTPASAATLSTSSTAPSTTSSGSTSTTSSGTTSTTSIGTTSTNGTTSTSAGTSSSPVDGSTTSTSSTTTTESGTTTTTAETPAVHSELDSMKEATTTSKTETKTETVTPAAP